VAARCAPQPSTVCASATGRFGVAVHGRAQRSYRRKVAVLICGLAVLGLAACGSSSKQTKAGGGPTTATTVPLASVTTLPPSTTLGVGVTPTEVKIGVALVDFNCIKQFTDAIRENQQQIYQAYIDNVNANGGVAGRKIVAVYKSYCPIGSAGALSTCTSLTEDSKVFAVIGTFIDFSGDAQTCVAKQHDRVLMTFNLTKAIIDRSPPGMMILPGTTPERVAAIMFDLMKTQHTLDGKKVAAVGDPTTANIVNKTIVPGLKALGVSTGQTAILNVGTADTTAAQQQLDSFIERWKSEGVTGIFMSGDLVSAKQFVQKIRQRMPDVMLLVDTTDVLDSGAKQFTQEHVKPNPYEGIITAGGPTAAEYDKSANWKTCSDIYQKAFGQAPPNAEAVVPLPGSPGKTLDTYGVVNDACQVVTMFKDIANKVGKYLDNTNWQNTVNTFGPIENLGSGVYASLHAGKYDVDDTHRLEEFDSSIPPSGNWKAITPLQDVSGG
jgi:ABC-type branched-subunit amino acid transport system substrate-binding protein